ncbi:thiamine-phosphate pyrophosphorylase [Paenibacillus sp. 1_12]|uniref:thiamine phosphate synthase n=1 Tax=Paenibacillus sp. 1_12 TaxID=1566278 RepID=UPI0008EA9134|nr:thiamine phosphate synthase [Paenibacillus sp. 1_12]SFL48609.1 thiamine-phosphate pyrophosphorylase [Paenibacillus sp. 1_12]
MFQNRLSHDLQVYLVMGLNGFGERTALEIAQEALADGVTMIQLREKKAPLKQVLEQGAELQALCRQYNVPFIVNDRIDVALLLDADGVHVGQDDIPGLEARRLLGSDKIIGISAGTMEEAEWAMSNGADYIGVGPIYSTSTKLDAGRAIGGDLIREIAARWSIPIVGIGGIDQTNAVEVLQAGANGIAVVSAIYNHPQPGYAANTLLRLVREFSDRA